MSTLKVAGGERGREVGQISEMRPIAGPSRERLGSPITRMARRTSARTKARHCQPLVAPDDAARHTRSGVFYVGCAGLRTSGKSVALRDHTRGSWYRLDHGRVM